MSCIIFWSQSLLHKYLICFGWTQLQYLCNKGKKEKKREKKNDKKEKPIYSAYEGFQKSGGKQTF